MLRVTHTRETQFKKNQAGNPSPSPSPVAAAASGGARMCGHGFLPIARENSKYPKGTPFVLNFLHLNTTNFHPMANVGLNAFSYL